MHSRRFRLALFTVVFLLGGLVATAPAGAAAEWHITESTTLSEDFYGAIFIEADDVTLDCAGFTVYPDGFNYQNGISIYGFDRVTVTNCVIVGGAQNLYAEYGEDLSFIGNTFLNAYYWDGLRVQYTTRAVIRDNYAGGNHRHGFAGWYDVDGRWEGNTAVADGDSGIALGFTVDAEVIGNTVFGAGRGGFASYGSSGSRYERNTAESNRSGFDLSTQTDITLVGNVSAENTDFGFGLGDHTRGLYADNQAHDNGIDGFYGWGATDVAYLDNLAKGNGSDGFYASGAAIVFQHNVANGNANLGFYVNEATGVLVEQNTSVLNRIGFAINDSIAPVVTTNNAANNREAGFGFWRDSGLTFTDNKANHNGGNGVNFNYLEEGLARGNSAVGNSGGFLVQWSESMTLDSNVVRNSGGYGITLLEGSGNTLTGNTVVKSSMYGIHVLDSVANLVAGNTSDRNGRYGFLAQGTSSSNTFDSNSAHKNGVLDAYDITGEPNTWSNNDFGTYNIT